MLLSVFFRLLRLVITGIFCSLPIYLGYVITITDNGILFLSFLAFVVATAIDAYRFSFAFWQVEDYFIGQLFPLIIYVVMGFAACLSFHPVLFNRIFLPLRFAGCLGMRTIESIAIVSIFVIVMVTVLRIFGARSGRLYENIYSIKNEDM